MNHNVLASEHNDRSIFVNGKVIEVVEDYMDEEHYTREQILRVRLVETPYEGKEIVINHSINLTTLQQLIISENDNIIVWINTYDTHLENCRVYSFAREDYLLYLALIFIAMVLLLGGKKGISAIISLAITLGLVFFLFFPMVINGVDPIISALLICGISAIITLVIIGDFKEKTYAAIIGTIGGISFSIVLTYIFGYLTNIQGIGDEYAEMLLYVPNASNYNFRDLLYAGIIIGTLGAIMDICMSISSAMEEIEQANKRITNMQLFLSGIRIGKDVLGTMTNTLILAYVGSSINLILVFYMYGLTLKQFINRDEIASEIIRSLTGSIGLVLAIPITALAFLWFRKS